MATKLTDRRFVNLFTNTYSDREGEMHDWTFASRREEPFCETGDKRPDAVSIIPFVEDCEGNVKVLMITQFRPAIGTYVLEFPAGLVDKGEGVIQAAKRELQEETGLVATDVQMFIPHGFVSSGLCDESISVVYARCEGEPHTNNTEASENINIRLMSWHEMKNLFYLGGGEYVADVKALLVAALIVARSDLWTEGHPVCDFSYGR